MPRGIYKKTKEHLQKISITRKRMFKEGKIKIRPKEIHGEKNPRWNGGKSKHQKGYIMILKPTHPQAQSKGYVPEHRLIMEKHVGRLLKKNEVVHHINGDVTDNRLENLRLLTMREHMKIHDKRRKRDVKGRFA